MLLEYLYLTCVFYNSVYMIIMMMMMMIKGLLSTNIGPCQTLSLDRIDVREK